MSQHFRQHFLKMRGHDCLGFSYKKSGRYLSAISTVVCIGLMRLIGFTPNFTKILLVFSIYIHMSDHDRLYLMPIRYSPTG